MTDTSPATEASVGLSLRARVRKVQEESGSVDPREIAAKVLSEVDPAEAMAALAETLPEYVRQIMTSGRKTASQAPPASSKVAAVRGWYERLMGQPVDVSGDGGKWKALRECTRDELLAVAQHRRKVAAHNLQTAEMYERLAKVLPAKKTVGDLPQSTVTSVFGPAAA